MEGVHEDICDLTFMPAYINALASISCLMSIIGGIIIFVTYAKIPEIRNTSRKMLLALTFSDIMTAAGNLVGIVRYLYLKHRPDYCHLLNTSDAVCVTQSFITTFSSVASFFWTVAIAAHVLRQLTHGHVGTASVWQLLGFHVVCWGVPGLVMVYAAGSGVLGQDNSVDTGGWCWIKSGMQDSNQITWMIISGKGWEILCYVLTAALYVLSKLRLVILKNVNRRHEFALDDIEDFREEDQIYLYVPFILYMLRLWGTVRFFIALRGPSMNSVTLSTVQVTLLTLQSIGDSWQAFWNFVFFCLVDKTVRVYLQTGLASYMARVTACISHLTLCQTITACCRNRSDNANERSGLVNSDRLLGTHVC